jgi:hypothetical protein
MRADTYTYDVAVKCKNGKTVMFKTVAESKWEAEERTHMKFIVEQPDRTAYKAKRNYAKVRQMVGGVL